MNSSVQHTFQSFIVGIHSSSALHSEIELLCADIPGITLSTVTIKSLVKKASADLFIYEIDGSMETLRNEISTLQQAKPALPIVVVTHHPAYDVGIELLRLKIKDYLVFPKDHRRLYVLVQNTFQEWKTQIQQQQFLEHKTSVYDFNQIIGKSPQLLETLRLTRKVIASDYMTTLILGETGTGKELLVKAIHYNSSNKAHPFVEINCSAIPETLLESELFGYEKGSFTDARERKIGLFELADKGTIFLDEIGDISLLMQSKLLKVIEEKTMRRLGGTENIPVHARIVAATSKNLEELVRKGMFRQDLYFRLRILPLVLPPLRDRENDIPLLADYFLNHFNTIHRKNITGFTPEAVRHLQHHTWDGNVRELKHAVECAVVLCDKTIIDTSNFDFNHSPKTSAFSSDQKNKLTFSMHLEKTTLSEIEQQLVNEVLRSVQGNKSQAASLLGVSRARLSRILKQPPVQKKSKKK